MQRPKFGRLKTQDFSSVISHITEQTNCKKHDADIDEPCFSLLTDTGLKIGICGDRISRVYNGLVTEKSFIRRPKKEQAA